MRKAGLSPDNILWHTHLCNQSEGKVLLSGNHPSPASACQDVWSRTAECGWNKGHKEKREESLPRYLFDARHVLEFLA